MTWSGASFSDHIRHSTLGEAPGVAAPGLALPRLRRGGGRRPLDLAGGVRKQTIANLGPRCLSSEAFLPDSNSKCMRPKKTHVLNLVEAFKVHTHFLIASQPRRAFQKIESNSMRKCTPPFFYMYIKIAE